MEAKQEASQRLEPGAKVTTKHGVGELIKRDGTDGILFRCWVVRMVNFEGFLETYRPGLSALQEKQGGLMFREDEFIKASAAP